MKQSDITAGVARQKGNSVLPESIAGKQFILLRVQKPPTLVYKSCFPMHDDINFNLITRSPVLIFEKKKSEVINKICPKKNTREKTGVSEK